MFTFVYMAISFNIPNVIERVRSWAAGSEFFFEVWSTSNQDKGKKLDTILANPAALFIFMLLPDLASMGRLKLYRADDDSIEREEIKEHPLLDLLNKPNPMQSKEQFLWDFMFWRSLGSANMLSESKILRGNGKDRIYWLSPEGIEWPTWFKNNKNTIFLSDASITDLNNKQLKYKTHSQTLDFKYGQLKQFFDISNGIKGWFDTPSRVDALYKIVRNSDNALDAKGMNSHLAAKFIVSGKHDVKNVSTLPMGKGEKESIENKVMGKQAVHGMKSMIEIKRFLEDLGALAKLDAAFMNDAFIIGKMYNIPRDVIERFDEGSTYENQEKGRASVISYCIQPAAEDFCKGIVDYFGLSDDYVLELDYSHLPFVQTFEKDRAETMDRYATAFRKMVEAGADQEEAAEICGFQFTKPFREPKAVDTTQSEEAMDSVKQLNKVV